MKNKKILNLAIILLIGIFCGGFVLGQISHCCEKVDGGAWCQNSEEDECDTNYLMEPTACSSTSYCALGTCINKRDGECIENTPQRSCDSENGFWVQSPPEEIPQCQLGCCAIGDQAAFVTQAKCKSFASLYSIDTHFQPNVRDEISCIASAFPDERGACVFERELETTCKMTTRSECQAISEAVFHEGFLCTADELATNCAPTQKTTCVDGKDEVFFLDSCGNILNIYDSSKIKEVEGQVLPADDEEAYWTYITVPDCGDGINTGATSASCGDCNYYYGSTCKSYDRAEDIAKPDYGDYVCRKLDCEFDSDGDGQKEEYLHGETWCTQTDGTTFLDVTGGVLQNTFLDSLNTNLPGSRFFRMVCYNGEVTVEPCADRRAEVCIESTRTVTERNNVQFKTAVCRVNAWQSCVGQTTQLDCEDSSIRDCQWVAGRCVPLVSPGFNFWAEDESEDEDKENAGEAQEVCAMASTTCTGTMIKPLEETSGIAKEVGTVIGTVVGKREIEYEGGDCFEVSGSELKYVSSWGEAQNKYCVSLGDCQGRVSKSPGVEIIKNYLGFN